MSLSKPGGNLQMGVILDGQQSTKMTVCEYSKAVDKYCQFLFYSHFSIRFVDTNEALHFYSHDNAHTSNGVLNITTVEKENVYKAFNEHTKQFYADKKYVQSGMLQSWNKFCFVGGIVEFSAKLPGDPHKGGLWPARKFRKCTICFSSSFGSNSDLFSIVISVDARKLGSGNLCRFFRLCLAIQLQPM
jgi:beta-glucanase (GH16 family)